jgi:hypothetical protein
MDPEPTFTVAVALLTASRIHLARSCQCEPATDQSLGFQIACKACDPLAPVIQSTFIEPILR